MKNNYLEKLKCSNNKGITLIALVVTIVVLLILAAISISTLFGENGLVYKAKESKLNTEIAKEKEQIQLAVTAALNHNETPKLAEDRFAEELTKNIGERDRDYTLVKEGDKFKITYVDSKRSYTVDADGKIEGPTNPGENPGGVEGQAIGYFINGPVYVFPGTTDDFEAWEREQYDDNMTENEQNQMVYEAMKYWQGADFSDSNDEILEMINQMYSFGGFGSVFYNTYGVYSISELARAEGYIKGYTDNNYPIADVKEWMIACKMVNPREYFTSKYNQKYTISLNGETYEYNPSEKCAMFYIDQANTYKATITGADGNKSETNIAITETNLPYAINSSGELGFSKKYGFYDGLNVKKHSIMKNVIINDTYNGIEVKKLENWMFCGPNNIETVRLPNGLTEMGDIFGNCSKLKSITIPSSVETIGGGTFVGCTELEVVKLQDGLRQISGGAFTKCNKIKTIELPSTLMSYDRVFKDLEGLETVIIKEGVKGVDGEAFRECKNLKTVEIPSTVEYIANFAFYGCEQLEKADIPDGVKSIGERTFENCKKLNSINLPEGLEELGMWCFSGCDGLTTVTIPSTVTNMGNSPFSSCTNLKTIRVNLTQEEAEDRWGQKWAPSGVEVIYNN